MPRTSARNEVAARLEKAGAAAGLTRSCGCGEPGRVTAPSNVLRLLEARVVIYQHFSMAFLEPGEELARTLSGGAFLANLKRALAQLAAGPQLDAPALPEHLQSLTREELADQYRAVLGNQACAPCETHDVTSQCLHDVQNLADIVGFYAAFGLEISPQDRLRPDHISVQLEFLYLLVLKEAYALTNHLGDTCTMVSREARSRFLHDHVGRWMPGFCERLRKRFPHTFYGQIAAFLERFLLFELTTSAIDLRDRAPEAQGT